MRSDDDTTNTFTRSFLLPLPLVSLDVDDDAPLAPGAMPPSSADSDDVVDLTHRRRRNRHHHRRHRRHHHHRRRRHKAQLGNDISTNKQ
jgi:hypothetical protein